MSHFQICQEAANSPKVDKAQQDGYIISHYLGDAGFFCGISLIKGGNRNTTWIRFKGILSYCKDWFFLEKKLLINDRYNLLRSYILQFYPTHVYEFANHKECRFKF